VNGGIFELDAFFDEINDIPLVVLIRRYLICIPLKNILGHYILKK
jgi:hypothetical protein